MKLKTINKCIKSKMLEWLATISDELLREKVQQNLIVTGGAIASMLLQEEVNDFDIYLTDVNAAYELAVYYCKDIEATPLHSDMVGEEPSLQELIDVTDDDRVRIYIKSSGQVKLTPKEEATYAPIYITDNAITLSDKIQIVTRFTGKPDKVHENYDFIHATNYWTFDEGLVTNKEALESIITKDLLYTGSKYPLCSILRTKKFILRGWAINAGQYLKMCLQLNELDLLDIDVLREQLMGVDSAYFSMLLNALDADLKKEGEEPKAITSGRVIKLIDEVFNLTI